MLITAPQPRDARSLVLVAAWVCTGIDAGLQLGEIGPGAPVQWQLAHLRPGYNIADFRRSRFDNYGAGADFPPAAVVYADLECDVDFMLRSNRQIDALDDGSGKASMP